MFQPLGLSCRVAAGVAHACPPSALAPHRLKGGDARTGCRPGGARCAGSSASWGGFGSSLSCGRALREQNPQMLPVPAISYHGHEGAEGARSPPFLHSVSWPRRSRAATRLSPRSSRQIHAPTPTSLVAAAWGCSAVDGSFPELPKPGCDRNRLGLPGGAWPHPRDTCVFPSSRPVSSLTGSQSHTVLGGHLG